MEAIGQERLEVVAEQMASLSHILELVQRQFESLMSTFGDLGSMKETVARVTEQLHGLSLSAAEYEEWTKAALEHTGLERLGPAIERMHDVLSTKPNWMTDVKQRTNSLKHRLEAIQDADLPLHEKVKIGVSEAAAFTQGTFKDLEKLSIIKEIMNQRISHTHDQAVNLVTHEIKTAFAQVCSLIMQSPDTM